MNISIKEVTNCTIIGDGNDIIFNDDMQGRKAYELKSFLGRIDWGMYGSCLVLSIQPAGQPQEYRIVEVGYGIKKEKDETIKEIETIEI